MSIIGNLLQRFRGTPLVAGNLHDDADFEIAVYYANRDRRVKEGFRDVLWEPPPLNEYVQFERADGRGFIGRWPDFAPDTNIAGLWWRPLNPTADLEAVGTKPSSAPRPSNTHPED